MPLNHHTESEVRRRKRLLRSEIARTRSSTTAAVSELRDERRRLTSWRTYVKRFPMPALGVAFAVGLWLAAARPSRRLPSMLTGGLLRWGLAAARSGIFNDFKDSLLAGLSRGADNNSQSS